MVVEACGQEIVWTEPRDVNLETDPIGTNLAGHYRGHSRGTMSSLHNNGFQLLRLDGSVDFTDAQVDLEFMRAAIRGTDNR